MKLLATTIAIAIAGSTGAAVAGDGQTMAPVYVSAADFAACTPPNSSVACAGLHDWIRANFSKRELGMLFGARTSYPESLTGGIDRLQARYHALVREYVAQLDASDGRIAAK